MIEEIVEESAEGVEVFDEEEIDDDPSSDELMPKAFDPEVCEDSDAQEAVQYLLSVRQQAKNAPAYTECKEVENTKETDGKYLGHTKLKGQFKVRESEWEKSIYQQFLSVRQNIMAARQWKKEQSLEEFVSSLSDYDSNVEQQLKLVVGNRNKFISNLRSDKSLIPTLNFMVQMDFVNSLKVLEWLVADIGQIKELSYQHCFWAYCMMALVEAPVDCECNALLNLLMTKCVEDLKSQNKQTEGMLAVIIGVIKIEYRQFFME